jgi:hypothetical protein
MPPIMDSKVKYFCMIACCAVNATQILGLYVALTLAVEKQIVTLFQMMEGIFNARM